MDTFNVGGAKGKPVYIRRPCMCAPPACHPARFPHAMSRGAHVGDAVGANVSAPAMPARRTTRSAAAAPDHAVTVMRR